MNKLNGDKSRCCNAPTKLVGGIGDFSDHDEAITMHYECTKCGIACDLALQSPPAEQTVGGEPTMLTKSERWNYERLVALEVRGLEEYQKMRKAPALSQDVVLAFINQLSPWNLKTTGKSILEVYVATHTAKAVEAARLNDNHDWDAETFKNQGVIACSRCATTYQTRGNKPCTGKMAKIALRATLKGNSKGSDHA